MNTDKLKALLQNKKIIGVAVAILVTLLTLGWGFSQLNSAQGEGTRQEQALNAQYLDNQNELSAYISTFYETLGISDRKTEQLDKVLTDAVTGRYDGGVTLGQEGQLISALQEAYPDLSGLDSYDEVIAVVRSGRESYRAKQTKLLDMLARYDSWRQEDLIRSVFVNLRGFPSSRLVVEKAGVTLRGQDALDEMYRIVLTQEARDAYDTKQQAPLTIPSGTTLK